MPAIVFSMPPVSGGVVGAEAGTLTIMAGGADEHWVASQPDLSAIGDKLLPCRTRAGDGAMVRRSTSFSAAFISPVIAEAFAHRRKAGLEPALLLKISRPIRGIKLDVEQSRTADARSGACCSPALCRYLR